MRIAVVSDIHGNLPALQAVVHDFSRRGIDRVINLGDSLSGPLLPRETADYLMASGWLHLAGNHERQVLALGPCPDGGSDADVHARALLGPAHLAWMATLTHSMPCGDDVWLCHGTPRSDIEYFLDTVEPGGVRIASPAELQQRLAGVRASLVLCGHTHHPRALRAPGGPLIVNPGSVGLQAYDDDRPYAHLIENGSPDARYAIVERTPGGWTAALIAVPYAHEAMAALAETNGRPDWAIALRTGRMSAA